MVPDYNTVDKAKSLMEKVRNGEVVTQEEADAPVSGSTSTDSTSTETVTEPGTVASRDTGCDRYHCCRWNYNRRRS